MQKKYIWLILMALSAPLSLFAQNKNIGGVINTYKSVVSISSDRMSVTLNDATGLLPGDTVLIMQMKGAIMYGYDVNNAGFGTVQDTIGAPGQHEFMIIEQVSTSDNSVSFTRPLKNSYDAPGGVVQLIKVPYYASAHVTSTLTSQPWDGETGGVLVFVVGGKLSLQANIDVTGTGFRGGASSENAGAISVQDNNDPLYYHSDIGYAGTKGEGLANFVHLPSGTVLPILPDYAKGRGASLTGGGGGNGLYAGGGGGSGWNAGGRGGYQAPASTAPFAGIASGGTYVKGTSELEVINTLYLGGGGGGSTYTAPGTATDGANGGGIVIIICGTLEGNGYSIIADGATPPVTASETAGAGGGGGGGAIALYTYGSATNLTMSAQGGKGGDTETVFGDGGGGGGGLIRTKTGSTSHPPDTYNILGGNRGTSQSPGSNPGEAGELANNYEPHLNGFLFNNVTSQVTGNNIDSVCYTSPATGETLPPIAIEGTELTLPENAISRSIRWEWAVTESPGSEPANSDYAPLLIANGNAATGDDYSGAGVHWPPPPVEDDIAQPYTIWIRRVVTADMPAPEDDIIDTSAPVRITVQAPVEANTIGNPATLCYGQNPQTLIPTQNPTGGNGIYNYTWETSADGHTFTTPANNHTGADYTPPANATATAWYRRTVTSGQCASTSPAIELTVIPAITNNIPMLPSGQQDTALCIGAGIAAIAATQPGGGNGTYTYQWQTSTDNTHWSDAGTGASYTPPPFAATTWYRRTVASGACTDTSAATVKVTVWQPIDGNTITPAPELCTGYTPQPLTGTTPTGGDGLYRFLWQQSTDGGITWNPAEGQNTAPDGTYQPPALHHPVKYRRTVTSGTAGCYTSTSNTIDITLYPMPPSNINAGPDTTLYSFDRYYTMQATPTYTYETAQWNVVTGAGNFDTPTRSDAHITTLADGLNTFLWTVTNGPCIYTDTVTITLRQIFIPNAFSPNGDGINDQFEILGLDLSNQHAQLTITNTAGTEIYRTTNKNGETWNNWDGRTTTGHTLAESTYYYRLTLESKNTAEPPYTRKGYIILKRN